MHKINKEQTMIFISPAHILPVCPFTQQLEPIACCGQKCGRMTCDDATVAGLNATLTITETAAQVGRALGKHWLRPANFSYYRSPRANGTRVAVRQCERNRDGFVTPRLRGHTSNCRDYESS